jgi:[FeFe] hydrogenase H-cluster maturation GTPase HydF
MEKLYIGIYGSVNSGKSTLINRLAGQDIAIVSANPGTTTDPVKKLIELEGIGPAVLIDSAGLNDTTELGSKRVQRTIQTLDVIDMALLIIESGNFTKSDEDLAAAFKSRKIPFLIINNKKDLPDFKDFKFEGVTVLPFSAKAAAGTRPVLEAINEIKPAYISHKAVLLDDIVEKGDIVVLVTPIDSAAPKGRLIMPQVNAIRNLLDNNAVSVVLQVSELAAFLKLPVKIKLVVTDSQVFKEVNEIVPREIPLTSFSILFARMKGDLSLYLKGVQTIAALRDGDKVLILESCSHSAVTCEDIGRVKLPALISKKSGKKLGFKIIAGLDPLPQDISSYSLVIQCGGCMVTKHQLMNRISAAVLSDIPVTNYGIAIAYATGILDRVVEVFK